MRISDWSSDVCSSDLSVATIVMQTDIKGGSMHTVRFTLEQGRLLIAPVPQGRHAEEPKSQGILALTQMAGSEFAQVFGANVEYERLINKNFYSRPLATGIRGREIGRAPVCTPVNNVQLVCRLLLE